MKRNRPAADRQGGMTQTTSTSISDAKPRSGGNAAPMVGRTWWPGPDEQPRTEETMKVLNGIYIAAGVAFLALSLLSGGGYTVAALATFAVVAAIRYLTR